MSTEVGVELDAQYRQLREECGLLDRSERGMLRISGPEAAEYLQGQLTNDVEALAPNDGCYAALLDRKGHMQGDMRVLRLAPEIFLVDTEPEAIAAVRRHLETYKIGRDVEIMDRTGMGRIFSLIGPRSAELAGAPPLPRFSSIGFPIGGVASLLAGTSGGLDVIVVDPIEAAPAYDALLAAGAVPVSAAAAEILRVEAGVPRFGAEMGTETMPAEAGIVEAAVSFTKGCYIGQETVARLHYKGRPNRHLRGLRLSAPAEPGAPVLLGEKQVGTLGSAVLSPALGPIGLAILRREAEPGATVAVGEDGVTAEVTDLPFG